MNDKLTVGELVYKISGDMENLKTELKKAETQIGSLSKAMEKSQKPTSKLMSGFNLLKTAVAGFLTKALLQGIVNLAKAGSEAVVLENSFARLANNIGLKSTEVLFNLKQLSAGTISNKDLILSANRAIVLGVAKNMDEFSTLMQVARIRARDMGISTTQAFDNIVTGIGRSSPLILDNLGIVIKQQEAYDQYAKSLNKTSDELTTNEQREAIKFAVLENGKKQIKEVGELTLSYADRIAQTTATISNFKENIGKAMLPAMASVLDQLNLGSIATGENSDGWNNLSKSIFKGTNFLITVGKAIILVVKAITGLGDTLFQGGKLMFNFAKNSIGAVTNIKDNFASLGKGLSKIFKGDFQGALDEFKTRVSDQFKDTTQSFDDFKNNTVAWGQILSDQFDSVGESALNAFDDKRFEETTKGVEQGLGTVAKATEDAGDSASGAGDKIKEFQGKLVSLTESATKAREELETKLGDSFKKFGDDIKGNFQDTVENLAQIVVGAEDKIKSLKDQLSTTEDSTQRADIQKQIKEQEAILDSREDFEKRQADRITAIRTKLGEAGIDATKAGLDNLLNVRSLEEQIEEERRIANLNDFQKFEEEQSKKLLVLTDSFITETTLLQQKIETQKGFEKDLTAYLLSENSKRLDGTDKWANATIEKYKEVADSLKNLLSTEAQVKNIKTSLTPSTPYSTPTTSGSGNSTSNTTNNNVTAPVTINGQNIQNFSAKELSAILGFELNKFIR